MGSLSIWHWLVVLLIVALIFGTKRLRNIGGDVGSAVKSFRKGLQDDDKPAGEPPKLDAPADPAIDPTTAAQRERESRHPGDRSDN